MLVGIPLEQSKSTIKPKECAVEMSDYLVEVAQKRCKASFARVFNYFAPRLRSYALKQMGNEALAMELPENSSYLLKRKSDGSLAILKHWPYPKNFPVH